MKFPGKSTDSNFIWSSYMMTTFWPFFAIFYSQHIFMELWTNWFLCFEILLDEASAIQNSNTDEGKKNDQK